MGTQSEILRIIDYWWNIPDTMRDEGAEVYISHVNGMDSIANKGVQFKANLLYFLAASGASKANIIGHSHGTVYTRYAFTNLGLSSKVARHTSVGGPHRGSSIADLVMGAIPDAFEPFVGGTLDLVYSFMFGDKNGDAAQNGRDMVRS
jgi:triacylglycerol lipase